MIVGTLRSLARCHDEFLILNFISSSYMPFLYISYTLRSKTIICYGWAWFPLSAWPFRMRWSWSSLRWGIGHSVYFFFFFSLFFFHSIRMKQAQKWNRLVIPIWQMALPNDLLSILISILVLILLCKILKLLLSLK